MKRRRCWNELGERSRKALNEADFVFDFNQKEELMDEGLRLLEQNERLQTYYFIKQAQTYQRKIDKDKVAPR